MCVFIASLHMGPTRSTQNGLNEVRVTMNDDELSRSLEGGTYRSPRLQ